MSDEERKVWYVPEGATITSGSLTWATRTIRVEHRVEFEEDPDIAAAHINTNGDADD